MIIYIDGIFDLFHYGHIELFNKCKNMFPNVILIVGVMGDGVATSYKRKPIYNEKHRYALVKNSRNVDKIIENPPLIVTKEFMEEYKIDYVVHAFANTSDETKQDQFFSYPRSIGAFKTIEYCNEISTTDIINRIIGV